MEEQNQKLMEGLPKKVLDAGKKETERWKLLLLDEFKGYSRLQKIARINAVEKVYASKYNSFFSDASGRLTEPNWERSELMMIGSHKIPLQDSKGKDYPTSEIVGAVFAHVVLFRAWLEEQHDALLTKSTDYEDDEIESNEKKKNPWKLTNAQLILMFKIGLGTMDLELDLDTIERSNLARLIHMMAGIPKKPDLSDSTLYSLLKKKKDKDKEAKASLKDLKEIKRVFVLFGFQDGTKIIDDMIRQETNHLKTKQL